MVLNFFPTMQQLWSTMDHYGRTMDHNTLIILLSDMGTPGWLLKLVVAFLEDRKIILNHNGCTTNEESLP